jgi:alpha-amylase
MKPFQRFTSFISITILTTLIASCGQTSEPFSYNIQDVSNENGSVWYEIFVQSFYDANGDGIGDFAGVVEKLDYLEMMGVAGIWFMPIHPGSSYHLYDVTDYYGIAPKYGTMDDFLYYLDAAKTRNIKTILDLVVNHTSNMHPWFVEGRLDFAQDNCGNPSSKCHYYNFSRSQGEGYEPYGAGIYAEARFWSGMPDLNLDNPYVKEEIRQIMQYWFDLGVDGFRLDAVTSFFTGNTAKNIEFLSWLGDEAKGMKSDSFIVAEGPWSPTSSGLLQYYPARIDSFFNFPVSVIGNRIIDRVRLGEGYQLARVNANFNRSLFTIRPDAIDTPFLSNHDLGRLGGVRFVENDDLYHKLLSSIYLLMPGRPFMYYGEEISMRGSGRDENKRLPMIWSETDKTGETLPPTAADYNMSLQVTKGAYDQLAIPNSLINHYRKTIAVRNQFNHLIERSLITALELHPSLYALTYEVNGESLTILTNVSAQTVTITNQEEWQLLDAILPTTDQGSIDLSHISIPGFSTFVMQ